MSTEVFTTTETGRKPAYDRPSPQATAEPPFDTANALSLGGSFDPPHVGHLLTARFAAEAAGFNGVRLVVAGRSPFKSGGIAAAPDRAAMCHAAVDADRFFFVDKRELDRRGPSYTADTASELRDELAAPPAWLVGADLLPGLPRWHRAAELLAVDAPLVRFVVMRRPGFAIDWPALPPEVRHLEASVVEVPQIDLSSTLIRDRVARGLSIRHMVPDAVDDLIRERGLYRAASSER